MDTATVNPSCRHPMSKILSPCECIVNITSGTERKRKDDANISNSLSLVPHVAVLESRESVVFLTDFVMLDSPEPGDGHYQAWLQMERNLKCTVTMNNRFTNPSKA